MGRATGLFRRTGSGTSAQTSGCDCRISGTRSTVAASALSPRSTRPCSISSCGSASWEMRKHARERKFSDTASPGKEQRVRDAAGAESPAECRDDAFIAEKIGKGHSLPPLARGGGRKHSFDRGKDVDGYFFGLANRIVRRVKTLDGCPGRDA